MADGVVFKNNDDFNAMARAVAAVNRGALEHPFHRRQAPIIESGEVLIKSVETTKILGPRYANIATGTDNIYTTGKGCVVDPVTGDYDETEEVDVDTSQIGDALVFPTGDSSYPLAPQYTFWAINLDGVYYATGGGTNSFPATVDSAYSGDIYYVQQDSPYPGDMTAAESLFDEALIEGQSVLVKMVGNRPTIDRAGCVP